MLLAVPFAAFFTALVLGHVLSRAGRADMLAAVAAALAATGGWALWREAHTPGIELLLYTLLIWGAVLPGLLALAAGAIVGWLDERGVLTA